MCVVLSFFFRLTEQGSVVVFEIAIAELERHSVRVRLKKNLVLLGGKEADLDFDEVFETL